MFLKCTSECTCRSGWKLFLPHAQRNASSISVPRSNCRSHISGGGSTTCPVCQDIILDKPDGVVVLYCEGICNAWIHRRCAGLSLTAFAAINNDSGKAEKPYECPHSHLVSMLQEITVLSSAVEALDNIYELLRQEVYPRLYLLTSILLNLQHNNMVGTLDRTVPPLAYPPTHVETPSHPSQSRRFNIVLS
uniref:Zinc finger PHD-type domain-containing protein n=1 Tax=Amphimedon queenslandica TaxID=400682 RepID=A0A1X7TSL4_AMPQE